MIELFLFLAVTFLVTFLLGGLIEKAGMPWIFASMILGVAFAIYNPFTTTTSSDNFLFLAELGMYFLLFVVGFELDINKLKKQSKFVLKSTLFIILLEGFLGMILVKFLFHLDWTVAFIVALSFATVGEAILVPILEKFKLVNSKLGQYIIGIGSIDDIIELIVFILAIFLIGPSTSTPHIDVLFTVLSLFALVGFTYGLSVLKTKAKKFLFTQIETLFVLSLFVIFIFLALGSYAHATAIAALLAGISLKTFIPDKRLKLIESEIKTMSYGFFAPLFFVWVGVSMDITSLFRFPYFIIPIIFVSGGAKILASWLLTKKELGAKKSILLGIGLSVRFSTGIIILKILKDNMLINNDMFTIIIASSIIFTLFVPVIFSYLVNKWKIAKVIS